MRDGDGELKAMCLVFFWKKLMIEAWAEMLVGLYSPFLELLVLGCGAIVPSPGDRESWFNGQHF